jgi:flagellar basal-body rod protein FlgB
MDYNQIALFDLAGKRLAWVDKRQELLAQNIANADTPGWLARDLSPFAAQLAQAGVGLARTDPMHLAGTAGGAQPAPSVTGERAPDGNGVAMDVELAKVADTETTHDLVDDLYTKYLGMFRTALDR